MNVKQSPAKTSRTKFLVNNWIDLNPLEIQAATQRPDSEMPLVHVCYDHGPMHLQHTMTVDQANQMAWALKKAAMEAAMHFTKASATS